MNDNNRVLSHRQMRLSRRLVGAIGVCSLVLTCLIGCVPTPSENANVAPKVTDLHSFFTPSNPSSKCLWHHIPSAGRADSSYFLLYDGQKNSVSSEGYWPISVFNVVDTAKGDTTHREAFISDSLVVYYYGSSFDPLTPRIILFHDTLQVGASWTAADNFRTTNGAAVSIKAFVESYYPETNSAGKSYSDVFVVSYTSIVKGALLPLEEHYQNGARISRYFARGVGDILERCTDKNDSLIWTNELVETRVR